MWDHAGMVHVGPQPCPSMRDGGAGISLAQLFFMAMNRPEKICPACVTRNRQQHDDFVDVVRAHYAQPGWSQR